MNPAAAANVPNAPNAPNWSRAEDMRAALLRRWQKGEWLTSLVTGEAAFPLRLPLKTPSPNELHQRFDEARAWANHWRSLPHYRVEEKTVANRVLGSNALPCALWLDQPENLYAVLGVKREVAQFTAVLATTRTAQPGLLPWLATHPLRALAHAGEWDKLLAIINYLQQHPRPGVYLRQLDLPGIDSKFIEQQRAILSELLDLCLPPESIATEHNGSARFARRYGFLDKPQLLRVRLLDPNLAPGWRMLGTDLTIEAQAFAQWQLPLQQVLITENEINFLALPEMAGSIAIFGAGYGFDALRQASWLRQCRVRYWGDIDTHGFAILDQLRHQLPQVESLLMDRATLLAWRASWGVEEKPTRRELTHLRVDEAALYQDLCTNALGQNVRLEQERIGFEWVRQALGLA